MHIDHGCLWIHSVITVLSYYQDPKGVDCAPFKGSRDGKDRASNDDEQEREEYLCPITQVLMTDPVISCDGHTYEKMAIENWLRNHNTSPMTNARLQTKQLFPNHSLRSMIAQYRSKQKGKE